MNFLICCRITLNEIVVDFVNFHSNFGRKKCTLHDVHGNRSGDRVNEGKAAF